MTAQPTIIAPIEMSGAALTAGYASGDFTLVDAAESVLANINPEINVATSPARTASVAASFRAPQEEIGSSPSTSQLAYGSPPTVVRPAILSEIDASYRGAGR